MKALGMNCSLWNNFGLTVFGLGIIVLIKRGFLDPWRPFSKWVTSQTLKLWQSLLRESLENLIDWILLKKCILTMEVIFSVSDYKCKWSSEVFHLLKWHFFPFVNNKYKLFHLHLQWQNPWSLKQQHFFSGWSFLQCIKHLS